MKKIASILTLLVVLLCGAMGAYAESGDVGTIKNGFFSDWLEASPAGWDLVTGEGRLDVVEEESGNICARLICDTENYAFVSQGIELKPSSAYRISCLVNADSVTGEDGVNMNIYGQNANSDGIYDTGGDWVELEMYVNTNVDEYQYYELRIGMGSEFSPSLGTVLVDEVTIDEISEVPTDKISYSLIGSFSEFDNDGESNTDEPVPTVDPSKQSNVTYNDAGVILSILMLMAAMYLVLTGRWAPRLGHALSTKTAIILAFTLAFVLRVFIALREPGHITDLQCFEGWSLGMVQHGFSGFYESGIFCDYPPGYMYPLWLIGQILQLVGITYESPIFKVMIEMPAILSDLALAYVLYRFAKKRVGQSTSTLLQSILLFSPMLITVSCSWGQIDSVFTLGIVGVIYLLTTNKKFYACLLFMVMLMVKPQALLIGPIILIVFLGDVFRKDSWKRTLIEGGLSIVGMFVVYALISLPMKGGQGFFYVFERMLDTTTYYGYGTVNAFNLMALLNGNFTDVNQITSLGVSYSTLGVICIVAASIGIALWYFKKRDKNDLFFISAVYILAIFTLGHTMHERYIFPAAILMMFAAVMHNSRRIMFSSMLISAFAAFNIYVALIFKADYIYSWLTVVGGVACLLVFAFSVYVAVMHIFFSNKEQRPLKLEELPLPSPTRLEHAKHRIENVSPHQDRRMTRRDYIVMISITVVYAIVAFINLGSTVIPAESPALREPDTQIVLTLDEPTKVNKLKYYAGYCEGKMSVSYSEDGETYFDIPEAYIDHPYAKMFKWNFVEMQELEVSYLKLTLLDGYMEMRELGLSQWNNSIAKFTKAEIITNGVPQDASYLIDEQGQIPEVTTYMTDMYFDEIYHARTAYEYMHDIYPYEITHPPLGKSILAIGIHMFGMNPFGWRFMGTLFGVFILPLAYIFGKRLFKKSFFAAISTIIFASDTMHYALTRIATIDSYSVFFIMLMYFFMYEYTQHNFNKEKLSRTLIPLGLCGVSFALGAATKWLCIYAGLGLAIIFFYTMYQRGQEFRYARANGKTEIVNAYKKKLYLTLLFCVGVFIVIPIIVYIISYYPYYSATIASGGTYGLKDIWANQEYMLNYHGNLVSPASHPYNSSVYTWVFSIRPVFFFSHNGAPPDMTALIWCLGNPVVWWSGVAAVLYLLGLRKKGDVHFSGLPFVGIAALSQLLPWMLVTRETFNYHFFATLPFLIYAIVFALRHIHSNYKYGKTFVYAFVGVCVGVFVLFYPVVTGTYIPKSLAYLVQWLPTWPIL